MNMIKGSKVVDEKNIVIICIDHLMPSAHDDVGLQAKLKKQNRSKSHLSPGFTKIIFEVGSIIMIIESHLKC